MSLVSLKLKNFRNHKNSTFTFPLTTVIIGPNTIGKSSVLEAIQFLSHGKSFKAEKEIDVITTGQDFSRIEAKVKNNDTTNGEASTTTLAIILAKQEQRFSKKYLVNNVSRRLVDFTSHFRSVLFTPENLDIITGSPNLRRTYIASILFQTDKKYRMAQSVYEKALKQRNKMLWLLREGKKYFGEKEFEYWDNILIQNGNIITESRENLVEYINKAAKEIFDFTLFYDKSTITFERLQKYYDAERASATTLVGPQRDDFLFFFANSERSIAEFGSRGEQRLAIFQTKILETFFIKEATNESPTLLLDDIFSELDNNNIHRILDLLPDQQTIITTTHKEFVPKSILKSSFAKASEDKKVEIIEL